MYAEAVWLVPLVNSVCANGRFAFGSFLMDTTEPATPSTTNRPELSASDAPVMATTSPATRAVEPSTVKEGRPAPTLCAKSVTDSTANADARFMLIVKPPELGEVPVFPKARSRKASLMTTSVWFTATMEPFTVRSPFTTASPATLRLSENVAAPVTARVEDRVDAPVTPNVPPTVALFVMDAEERVDAPAPSVPATTVLPFCASTENLLVATAKLPATARVSDKVVAPVTPRVEDRVAAPVTARVEDKEAAPEAPSVPTVVLPRVDVPADNAPAIAADARVAACAVRDEEPVMAPVTPSVPATAVLPVA